ncbi:MAG: hypothetical protein WBM09_01375 [Gallionella sp.]
MQKPMPHFTYNPPKSSNGYVACIEMDGQPIHMIKNLDAFYKEFGYTPDTRKAGVLPDEFMWNEYTEGNPSPYTSCLQMHIVEYLTKNSIAFISEYSDQYQYWLDDHIKAVTEKDFLCVTCRAKSFCQIGMSSSLIPAHWSAWFGSLTDDEQ